MLRSAELYDPLVGRWSETEPLLEGRLTQRVATLMARIEGEQHGHTGRVREWLARAVNAPRDPAWTADGVVSDRWAPVSPVTGALDAFRWRVPVEAIDAPAGALLAAKVEALVGLGAGSEAALEHPVRVKPAAAFAATETVEADPAGDRIGRDPADRYHLPVAEPSLRRRGDRRGGSGGLDVCSRRRAGVQGGDGRLKGVPSGRQRCLRFRHLLRGSEVATWQHHELQARATLIVGLRVVRCAPGARRPRPGADRERRPGDRTPASVGSESRSETEAS